MVAGLEEITSGDILIGGVRVSEMASVDRGVAMVFQSYALYPHKTVAENMSFGLRVFGADKPTIERKVKAAADILQLTPLLDQLSKHLSGRPTPARRDRPRHRQETARVSVRRTPV